MNESPKQSDFKVGDRVTSTILGYYTGIMGTILKKAQFQYQRNTEYIVKLDTGTTIRLATNGMKKINYD